MAKQDSTPDPAVARSLRLSIKDGVCYSVMAGGSESYFSLFALALKATPAQIGALAAYPQLFGALAQFASVRLLRWRAHRRRLIVVSVLLQAVTLLPLIPLALLVPAGTGVPLLLLCVVAYYGCGQIANPPWNSLMGDLVPPDGRGQYFGYRNRLISIVTFAALVGAGLILNLAEGSGRPWAGFAMIFAVGCVARVASAYYLARMHDPAATSGAVLPPFQVLEFIRRARRSNFTRFILFTGAMHLAVQIAGPFIAPYMRRDLGFSYLQFTLSMAAVVLVQFLTLNSWGAFSDRFGNKKVLVLTGAMLPVIPFLWLLAGSFGAVLGVQVFGGFVWAGFALSMGNYLFDTVSPPRRAICVALYNTANGIGTFIGASLGGWLATEAGAGAVAAWMPFGIGADLRALFLVSGLLRLVVALTLLRSFREERRVETLRMRDWAIPAMIRPFSGIRFDLFTGLTGRRRGRRDRRRFP